MRGYSQPQETGNPLDPKSLLAALDRFYPRLLTQIDRDPDSPTYGSCDRHFWMYRLNDFDSGVLQQASLTLAAIDSVADSMDLSACRYLNVAHRPYWRALAEAINRRTVGLLEAKGYLDEYYPGESSFPGTVFAAYGTLKSAIMLDQQEIIRSRGLKKTAHVLLDRKASAAANQDVATAAFLSLYARTLDWEVAATQAATRRLVMGPDGNGRFLEYGGVDLGYATVTLNYLAHAYDDGDHSIAPILVKLAELVAGFISPSGRLGGEFATRSTTYFLPFGLVRAASENPGLVAPIATLDLRVALDKLDDRYMLHYCLASVAMAARHLARHGTPQDSREAPPAGWRSSDHRDVGLFACRDARAAIFVGLNKGGSLQVDDGNDVIVDCGYRVNRSGKVYATCVLHDAPVFEIRECDNGLKFVVEARFQRYPHLVASPGKTIVLRLLRFLGPRFNAYFKKRLVNRTRMLPDVVLRRRIEVDYVNRVVTVDDDIAGLQANDRLYRAPPSSLRLVPSAKFFQDGEERYFLMDREKIDVTQTPGQLRIELGKAGVKTPA